MGKGLGKKKRPDFSEVALRVVKEATGEADITSSSESSENTPLSKTKTSHKPKKIASQ